MFLNLVGVRCYVVISSITIIGLLNRLLPWRYAELKSRKSTEAKIREAIKISEVQEYACRIKLPIGLFLFNSSAFPLLSELCKSGLKATVILLFIRKPAIKFWSNICSAIGEWLFTHFTPTRALKLLSMRKRKRASNWNQLMWII